MRPAEKQIDDEKMKTEPMFTNGTKPLKVGDLAPDFQLPTADGEMFALSDVLKKGPVILNFVKGTWCPFCEFHLKNLRQWVNHLQGKSKISILIISNESIDAIRAWRKKNYSTQPFASDIALTVSASFGIKLSDQNFARPATFLIDIDRSVRMAFIEERDERWLKAMDSSVNALK